MAGDHRLTLPCGTVNSNAPPLGGWLQRFGHENAQRRFCVLAEGADADKSGVAMTQLNAATRIEDLRLPPSNRLEALKGDRKGQWSIRINNQWRICFRFEKGDAVSVEIVDYH